MQEDANQESPEEAAAAARGGADFPQTRWSLVVEASQGDGSRSEKALAYLCERYWYPLYVFCRRRGESAQDAEDLTQGFFGKLLSKQYLNQAKAERGRLRSFLLAAFKHYQADAWDRESAQKRGGGHPIVSLEQVQAEERYQLEPRTEASPDTEYERRWALTFLDNVLTELRQEFERKNKSELFETLQPFLAWNSADETYAEAAKRLDMTESAVSVAVFRMRKRYGELIRELINDTVASAEEAEEELNYLLSVVRG